MTEQTETTATPEGEREIPFHGRKIWVRLPTAEQLLVWKRTVARIQQADTASWTGAEAMAALERGRRIIDSVIVHQADKDWLDDEMLDGNLGLEDAAKLILNTVEAFTGDDNRAARRAAKKPAKKAAKRKAAR